MLSGPRLYLNNCGYTSVGTLSIGLNAVLDLSNNAITAIDLSGAGISMPGYGNLSFAGNPVTTVTPGDGTTTGIILFANGVLSFNGCALNNANQNGLLAALVAMETAQPGNNAMLDLSGGTNATPDTTGLAAITTLSTAGWTIYNN